MWIVTAVFDGIDVDEKLYVNVFVASEALPPDGIPLTVPTAGVPPVPGGTVIVTDEREEAVEVVNEYV
jgi:hypothetical protein